MIRKAAAALIICSLVASPAIGSAPRSPGAAAPLSIAQAGAGGGGQAAVRRSGVPGGGFIAAAILAAVIAVGVLLATQDDEADSA